jgi:hypothetical protein
MQAAQLRWQEEPQRNPLILSAQVPGSRPGSVCVTMIKHQWLGRLAQACLCAYACVQCCDCRDQPTASSQPAPRPPTFLSFPPLATSGAALLTPTANSAF